MHQNKIWVGMIALVVAITLWFGGKALWGVYNYYRVDQSVVGEVQSWSVAQVGSDRFVLRAVYGFQVGGELYEGESALPKLFFLNKLAAQQRMERLDKENWTVWYRSKNPQVSQIGRVFPYKQCVYAVILFGVLAYFILLGRMAARADRGVEI